MRWFQNNDHADRKLCGEAKTHSKASSKIDKIVEIPDSDSDEEFSLAADHLKELRKDMEKSITKWDVDKVARLLSLTFKLRSQKKASNNHIPQILQEFPCLKEPVYVSIYSMPLSRILGLKVFLPCYTIILYSYILY